MTKSRDYSNKAKDKEILHLLKCRPLEKQDKHFFLIKFTESNDFYSSIIVFDVIGSKISFGCMVAISITLK